MIRAWLLSRRLALAAWLLPRGFHVHKDRGPNKPKQIEERELSDAFEANMQWAREFNASHQERWPDQPKWDGGL